MHEGCSEFLSECIWRSHVLRHDLRRLPPLEATLRLPSPSGARLQRLAPPDGHLRHLKRAHRFYLSHPAQNGLHHMQANGLLGFRSKESSIWLFHDGESYHNPNNLPTPTRSGLSHPVHEPDHLTSQNQPDYLTVRRTQGEVGMNVGM